MNAGQIFLIVIGRIFLGVIFVWAGVNQILEWQIMEEGVVSMLCDWHSYMNGQKWAESLLEVTMSWAPFLLGVSTFLQIVGGLLVILGIKVRYGAFFLFIFLLPITLLYHHFWFLEGQKRDLEMIQFSKNLSILGGIMILWAFGPIHKKWQHKHTETPS